MQLPLITLLILLASMASRISPEIASMFILDRHAIFKGEIWRIFTCHFVHFSNLHLLYNVSAFGIPGWILEHESKSRFGWLCILTAFFISISILIFEPDMWYYGGLSGIACGAIYYFALWSAAEYRKSLTRFAYILVIFLIPVKILAEICIKASILPYCGQQPFVQAPISHAVGILVAVLLYAAEKYTKPIRGYL